MPQLCLARSGSELMKPLRGVARLALAMLVCVLVLGAFPGAASSQALSSTDAIRNVPQSVKDRLKSAAGISRASWGNYQIDHRTPLWAGGTNSISNLQVLSVAAHKAKTAREARLRASLTNGGVKSSLGAKLTSRGKSPTIKSPLTSPKLPKLKSPSTSRSPRIGKGPSGISKSGTTRRSGGGGRRR